MTTAAVSGKEVRRHDLVTVIAIGVVACVGADMVHEALGHGIASWLTGDRILSISTVALQNAEASRLVSAAGTLANVVVGAISFLLLRRIKRWSSWSCFLWLFGAFNLMNSGYFVVSAALNSGDWANVIYGLSPAWLWRCLLGAVGVLFYAASILWTAQLMRRMVDHRMVITSSVAQLVLPAYLAGGAVMTVASFFNPISPSLILMSGIGASFGLNAGLLLVTGLVNRSVGADAEAGNFLPMSVGWVVLAVIVGGTFIAVLGPGIRFGG